MLATGECCPPARRQMSQTIATERRGGRPQINGLVRAARAAAGVRRRRYSDAPIPAAAAARIGGVPIRKETRPEEVDGAKTRGRAPAIFDLRAQSSSPAI